MLKDEVIETKEQFEDFMEKIFQELSNFDKFEMIHKRDEMIEEVIKEEASGIVWELALEEVEEMMASVDDEELPDPELPESAPMEIDDPGENNQSSNEMTTAVEDQQDEVLAKRKGMDIVMNQYLWNTVRFLCLVLEATTTLSK